MIRWLLRYPINSPKQQAGGHGGHELRKGCFLSDKILKVFFHARRCESEESMRQMLSVRKEVTEEEALEQVRLTP